MNQPEPPVPPPQLVEKPENNFRRTQRGMKYLLISAYKLYGLHLWTSLIIIAFHALVIVADIPIMQRLENMVLDVYFRARPPLQTHPAILFVEIEQSSIHALGRWPWPRQLHAVATHLLTEWKAAAVVFDISFSQPSNNFDDQAFTEALAGAGSVYFPVILEESDGEAVWIHSLKSFEEHARGTGHINITPDSDGTLRRINPFIEAAGEKHPHLAIEVAYDYLQKKRPASRADLKLPLDERGNFMINWAGKWTETFDHVSFLQLIKSFEAVQSGKAPPIDPAHFEGKICLIGLTATGHSDIKASPLESVYPAVGVHANVINSILTGQYLRPVSKPVNLLCFFIVAFALLFFLLPFRGLYSFIGSTLVASAWISVSLFLFFRYGVFFSVLNTMLLLPELLIASAICSHVLYKQEQRHLYKLATRDGLTGLYVIRHFRHMLNKYALEARIKKEPLSVILIDIDHFKEVNDTYGHAAGDEVLRRIADIIRLHVRQKRSINEVDIPGRYGGEEFILMVKRSKLEQAYFKTAERLRKAVEEYHFMWEGKRIPVTISLGVAMLAPDESIPDLMVRRADAALYRAKNEGRNRACLEDPPVKKSRP